MLTNTNWKLAVSSFNYVTARTSVVVILKVIKNFYVVVHDVLTALAVILSFNSKYSVTHNANKCFLV